MRWSRRTPCPDIVERGCGSSPTLGAKRDIIGILGRPDLIWAGTNDGSAQLYDNTNGGPLDLSFQHCGLVHKAMDTPAHWRGTNQALAALWSKARHSREWWL